MPAPDDPRGLHVSQAACTIAMAPNSKWIEAISPDETLSDAARRVVKWRLLRVRDGLRDAVRGKHSDAEVIHQLRVSTRRAAATMDSFDELLPGKRSAWMRTRLKRVRKATNDARDFDVLAERLTARAESDASGWSTLLERVSALRREAQAPLVEICEHLERGHFKRRVRRLARRIRWSDDGGPEPTFADSAVEKVLAAAEPLFATPTSALADVGQLHAFRILAKRLRYAMEIFVMAFEPRFRDELYPLVESLQERLGDINDHATAVERLDAWLLEWDDAELRGPLTELLEEERLALRNCRAQFDDWWTAERSADWRRRFDEVLAHPQVERVA
ncbi:MAG TPA: CHAD domain-containing protein [Pirellulales bacterium]|jgi:CHAD domain-containing protein|nr:CHAD domain-containing protein [Pirellulales bacterium]